MRFSSSDCPLLYRGLSARSICVRVACAEKLHHVPHHASTPQPDFPPHPRLLPSLLLLPTQKLTVPLLLLFPNQAMEEETLFHTKSAIPSPEFNGGRVKDDDDELLHHHDHLFLVGDLGEGHPQASSSSSSSPNPQG